MSARAVLRPLFLLLACAAPALGEESWQLLLMDGREAGYAHGITRELERDGRRLLETEIETLIKMQRMGRGIEVKTTVAQAENASGQLVRYRQELDMAASRTRYEGVVEDGVMKLTVTTVGRPSTAEIEWPDDVPGPAELERRIAAAGFEPGTKLRYFQFDPQLGEPMQATLTILGEEEVELEGQVRRLHKATIEMPPLPETTAWLDPSGRTVKTSTSMMGLTLEMVEVDAQRVASWVAGDAKPVEMFMQSTISANVRLPRPRSLESILYRVATKDGSPLPDLASDRQVLGESAEGGGRLLRIDVVVPPAQREQKVGLTAEPGPLAEYLASNPMIQCDDGGLKDFALSTIGDETDAWKAAVLLERAVYERIDKKSLDVAFASALETFVNQTGDCSEHAVLLAGLCRAAGIPARVAMGLVYVGGIFGGHAWTEVNIDGRWYGLDATIGRGSVDPTHLQLGDTSLKDAAFSTGLLGVLAGLGNLELEILEFRQGEHVLRPSSGHRAGMRDGRFEDPLEGVSFVVPDGWRVAEQAPDILDMTNRYVMATLVPEDGSDARIEVVSTQVPYDYSLQTFRQKVAANAAGPVTTLPMRVGGRDAVTVSFRPDAGDLEQSVAGCLADDTLYTVEGARLDDEARGTFHVVVRSLEIR